MADLAAAVAGDDPSTDDDSDIEDIGQPLLTVREALRVCQFTDAEATALIAQAIPDWHVFLRMTAKDIVSIAEDYGKRTINDGRIVFGYFRTKELQGLMHWVQDQNRMSKLPAEQQLDPMHLALAAANNEIRKNLADNMDTASKAADPGKLRTNTDWYTWSQGFINYLSTIPGCTGIPLSYVVREFDDPTDPEDTSDYLATLVLRAPLSGPVFMADRRQVHQLLTGKVLGESAEEWLRDHKRKNNGRLDFQALTNHFEGEGNVSRRISQAEALHKQLVYKQERAMKFTVFLNKLQNMFQIYKQEGEEKPESAKIRFLLDRTQAPHLSQAVTNLRYEHNKGSLTYSIAKNVLMTEVIKSQDHITSDGRNVASAESESNQKGKKGPFKKQLGRKHAPKGDQKIDHKTWNSLSREQQAAIRKYRDENGLPGGTKTIRAVSTSSMMTDDDITRIVAAIEAKQSSSGTTSVSSVSGSAGQAFGGKSEGTANRRNT